MQVRKMRLLRHKHGITQSELGRACALSPQRISEIELSGTGLIPETKEKLQCGFESVAQQREEALHSLLGDLDRHRESLFEPVEENGYEL